MIQPFLAEKQEQIRKFGNMVAGSSFRAWKLLTLIASAQKQFEDAEELIDIALDETTGMDQLQLLRLKSTIQIARENPKQAIENYDFSTDSSSKETPNWTFCSAGKEHETSGDGNLQNLSKLYTKLESLNDSHICVEKAKSIDLYNPQTWHSEGMLLKARGLYNKALSAFSVSLSIDPDHIPSLVSTAEVFMELGGSSLLIAKSFFMNALQSDPTNHEAWSNLGLILKNEGLISQAADCFQAAFELESTAPVQPIL